MIQSTGKKLLTILNELKPNKIAVVGDIILDQYTWGSVDRISPEGPIPVVKVENVEYRNGGSGCAASNISALKCHVDLYGYIGSDENGKTVLSSLQKNNINTDNIIQHDTYQTIVKNRILARQQQIVRIDTEKDSPISPEDEELVIRKFQLNLSSYQAVLISDYSKGFLTPNIIQKVIEACRKNKIPVIVDPGKDKKLTDYKYATAIKPNRHEAERYTGIIIKNNSDALKAAEKIYEQTCANFITLSLDKDGVLLYHQNGQHRFYSQSEHEVFDVTGAGDTFVSVLTAFLADGNTPESSVLLANIAAGLSVTHLGVVHLTIDEIKINIENFIRLNKISSTESVIKARNQYSKPLPLILVNGIFDNFSTEQILFLNALSKKRGDIVIAVNSDESVFRLTGNYPRMNCEFRVRLLSGFEFISWVIVFDEDDVSSVIRKLKPDMIAKGSTRSAKVLPVQEQKSITETGAKLINIEIHDQ